MSHMHVVGERDSDSRQSSRLHAAGVTARPTKVTVVRGRHQLALHAGIPASPLLEENQQSEFSVKPDLLNYFSGLKTRQ